MVIFMHIDYNNSCTRVFRMRLMVIDMCIDRTLGFWAQLGQKKYTLRVRGAVVSGQKTRVSGQEPEQSAKPAVDAPRAAIAFTPAGAIAPPGIQILEGLLPSHGRDRPGWDA
jgi:hypothetical protein